MIVKSFTVLLLLVATIGCGSDERGGNGNESVDQKSTQEADSSNDDEKRGSGAKGGELSEEEVATLLKRNVGEFAGTVVIKGADGTMQGEFPMTDSVRWIEEGKSIEMRVDTKLPDGSYNLIFTKFYDRESKRFALTRRMASEPAPEIAKPGAYETYDRSSQTFHGSVDSQYMPPNQTYTWTMQFMGDDKIVYRAEMRQDNKVQETRVETFQRVKASQP